MRVAVIVIALSAALALPASASAKGEFSCRLHRGPEFTFVLRDKTWVASDYDLRGFKTTCTFARTWVRRLAAKPWHGANEVLKGGPPGWACLSGPTALEIETISAGTCQNKADKRRAFRWDANIGAAEPLQKPAPNLQEPLGTDARYKEFDCKLLHGPRYTWTVPTYSGDTRTIESFTYELRGFGTTCTFAKRWVRKLATRTYRGPNKPLTGGPDGWRCLSGRISPNLHPKTVFDGNCQNRKDPRRVFDWSQQPGPDDRRLDPPTPTPEPPDGT